MREWLKLRMIRAAPTCTLWEPIDYGHQFRFWPSWIVAGRSWPRVWMVSRWEVEAAWYRLGYKKPGHMWRVGQ